MISNTICELSSLFLKSKEKLAYGEVIHIEGYPGTIPPYSSIDAPLQHLTVVMFCVRIQIRVTGLKLAS